MGIFTDFTYNLFMFPFEKSVLHKFRKKVVSAASGDVLELGAGTGINLKYFEYEKLDSLAVLDMKLSKSVKRASGKIPNIKLIEGSAEELPFEDNSFDTVVFTLVFCSVDNPLLGLSEAKRVLRADGRLIFIEHVRPKSHGIRKIADRINPAWNSFSNGCNINRETLETIKSAGFSLNMNNFNRKGVFITGTAVKTQ